MALLDVIFPHIFDEILKYIVWKLQKETQS